MARGGKRNGAGRKAGAVAKIDNVVRTAIIASGTSPLQVMQAMIKRELDSGAPDQEFLLELCKAAAPYCHAKMHDSKVQGALEIVHVPH